MRRMILQWMKAGFALFLLLAVMAKAFAGTRPKEANGADSFISPSMQTPGTPAAAQQPPASAAQRVDANPAPEQAVITYTSQLMQKVVASLIYPKEAKEKRLEGVSEISFVVTEAGEIKPNTLAIKHSSGYAILDACALKTVAVSAPFAPPPRELTLSLAIKFAVGHR